MFSSQQTILPASAQDVYYRDEIGNISTSHLQVLDDSVEVEVRPRFPLFGGWKTHYIIGYNLPSYEYLYTLGEFIFSKSGTFQQESCWGNPAFFLITKSQDVKLVCDIIF